MHTDAEESVMLNVIPRVRHSPNNTPHRTTHSPYDTSVFLNRTTERETAVEANVSPQVRGIMRPPQRNGAQDVTVGSSDSAGAASVMERRQQQQQPLLRVGGARSGTGNEGVSSMIADDDADVQYEQVRNAIFNSAPPEALQGGSAAATKTRTNKLYVMPPLGAATSGRSGGQERKQDSHDAPPDYGQSRGNDAKQSADASSASQMGAPAPMPLHQQHPKVENDAMDYQRHPRVMNLLPHHHHYQHQHHYQQHSYGPSFQGQMYDADYGERDGYDSSSQKRRFYSSAPPQVYQQYPGKFQQPPPLPQQQQQQHYQQHQQYSPMPHSFYSPPHADVQGCYPGGFPGHNVYSDPNNNHSSPTLGGDLRYSQDNTTSMHQRYNSNNNNNNNNNNKNRNSPLPSPQQQQQQPQQPWSRTQMPYSVPSTSPNMTIGMTSQRVPSPYPSSGDGSYTRYSPTAATTCPGVAPPPGPPYSGMGQNWQSQSQSQPYPVDMQHPRNVPPAYHGNPALAGPYNTGMHRQDYMDSSNCGQQSNTGAPPPPPPPPPPSHHHHHHHHHQHHQQQHQQWGYGSAHQQLPHPHQQQQWGYGSAHQQLPHPHQQQQPIQHPYPPEPEYNMPLTQHGFNRPSFGPPCAPGGNAAMAQHYNQQADTAYHPESEPYAPHEKGNQQQSFQKQPHQSYQQHYQQAPSNGRLSDAPTVGLPSHRQSQQRHGQQFHARRGDSNGWGRGRGSGYGRGEQQQQGRKSNAKVSGVVVRGIPQAQMSADAAAGNEQNCNDANVTTGHASSLDGGSEPNQVEESKK